MSQDSLYFGLLLYLISNPGRIECSSPLNIQRYCFHAKSLCYFCPPLSEFSSPDYQNLIPRREEISHRSFHGSRSGRSEEKNLIICSKDILKSVFNFFQNPFELTCPMMNDFPGLTEPNFLRKRCRSRSE